MSAVQTLFAVAALGAGPPAPPAPPADVTFQVRLFEMDGLAWRSSVYSQLTEVKRADGATVWTAPRAVVPALLKTACKALEAPRVTTPSNAPAHVTSRTTQKLVTGFVREADGPVNHASYIGYAPKVEPAREGMAATFTGRKLDQGVLTRLVLEDARVASVHRVKLSEVRETKDGTPGDTVGTEVQVPEFVRSEVAGEWLIPNDGVLLVSLGAHTVAAPDGRAKVKERLALVEAGVGLPAAEPVQAATFLPTPLPAVTLPKLVGVPAPAPLIPMPAAPLPTRCLPQPFDADGKPVALPPLPAGEAPPTALPDSAEPCATPQAKGVKSADDRVLDAESRTASYTPAADDTGPCASGSCPASAWVPAPAKTFRFRWPSRGQVEIELRATVSPSADAPAPPTVPDSK